MSNTGIVLLGGEPRIAGLLPDSQSHGTVFMAQSSAGYVGQGGVYKSTDYGLNWTQVYASTGNEPCSLAFDPTDHDVLMVNVWNDVMLRSEDGGDTWASYDPGFFGSRYMWDIASVRTQVGWRLYAGTETHGIWQANIGSMATYLPCVIK